MSRFTECFKKNQRGYLRTTGTSTKYSTPLSFSPASERHAIVPSRASSLSVCDTVRDCMHPHCKGWTALTTQGKSCLIRRRLWPIGTPKHIAAVSHTCVSRISGAAESQGLDEESALLALQSLLHPSSGSAVQAWQQARYDIHIHIHIQHIHKIHIHIHIHIHINIHIHIHIH